MFLRLYEHSHDPALLDLAAVALRQDLRRCVASTYGPLEVNEGRRTMPYLADGSVGIAFALDDYLAHRADERFADAAARIRGAAEGQFYGQTGLFYGRAGMILYLSREHPPAAAGRDPVVATHVRRLGWHALTYKGHLAFPGDQLLRLSMDLATGSAGVMLALGAALHDQPVHLPFLAAPEPPAESPAGTDSTITARRGHDDGASRHAGDEHDPRRRWRRRRDQLHAEPALPQLAQHHDLPLTTGSFGPDHITKEVT